MESRQLVIEAHVRLLALYQKWESMVVKTICAISHSSLLLARDQEHLVPFYSLLSIKKHNHIRSLEERLAAMSQEFYEFQFLSLVKMRRAPEAYVRIQRR